MKFKQQPQEGSLNQRYNCRNLDGRCTRKRRLLSEQNTAHLNWDVGGIHIGSRQKKNSRTNKPKQRIKPIMKNNKRVKGSIFGPNLTPNVPTTKERHKNPNHLTRWLPRTSTQLHNGYQNSRQQQRANNKKCQPKPQQERQS